jgi:hypothetical protein
MRFCWDESCSRFECNPTPCLESVPHLAEGVPVTTSKGFCIVDRYLHGVWSNMSLMSLEHGALFVCGGMKGTCLEVQSMVLPGGMKAMRVTV